MNGTHPTAEQLDRYRRRTASAEETIAVDAHIAECDRCFDAVNANAHLTYDQLEALADGRETAAPHLALCSVCRGELSDLRQMRKALTPARAPRRRRFIAAAAAAMLIAFIAAAVLFRPATPVQTAQTPAVQTTPVATVAQAPPLVTTLEKPRVLDTLITTQGVLRGGRTNSSFELRAPVATVVLEERPRFQWEAIEGAASYEITVLDLDRGTVVAGGTSTSPAWQSDTPLQRERTYVWQVAAQTNRGRIVAPGRDAPEARFHVAAEPKAGGTTPLERGIALATLGALDDAERELERAGAVALLNQVRGWRGQRPLPTTTNGPQ